MPKNVIQSTTQIFLEIHDITNDLLLLKSGGSALILTVNAINFGLLAEEEQDGVIYAYASLLNSLNYPIQIVIKSQTKDVTNYLQLLEKQQEQLTDKLKKRHIIEYRQFVGDLIQERNVLDKKFYVVIPASPLEMGVVSAESVLPGIKAANISTFEKNVILEKARNILDPRRDHLMAQFGRIGLFARQLKTQEIIRLFYNSYNPEAKDGQNLTDSRNYTTPLVRPSVQGVFMTDQQSTASMPNVVPQPPTSSSSAQQPVNPTTLSASLPTATPSLAVPSPAPAPSAAPTPSLPITPPVTSPGANPFQPPTPMAPTPPNPTVVSGQPVDITSQKPARPVSPEEIINAADSPIPNSSQMAPASSKDSALPGATPDSPVQIQQEINSTLQQLGGPTATPQAPLPTQTPVAAVPPTTPIPAVSGAVDQKDQTSLPDVPEI